MSFMLMLVGGYVVISVVCTLVVLCACVVAGRSRRNSALAIGRKTIQSLSRFANKSAVCHAPITPRLAPRQ